MSGIQRNVRPVQSIIKKTAATAIPIRSRSEDKIMDWSILGVECLILLGKKEET